MSLAGLIAVQRAEYGVPYAVSCRALGVSQAWFYKWRNGDRSPRHRRRAQLAVSALRLAVEAIADGDTTLAAAVLEQVENHRRTRRRLCRPASARRSTCSTTRFAP